MWLSFGGKYGHRMGFCGNMDALAWANDPLPELEKTVLRKLNAAKGGGYIFQSDHSVPSNVSAERYEFVLNTVRKNGDYPLSLGEWDIPDMKWRTGVTSRERVLAAIQHKESDRVPVDLGGTPSSGISAIAYGRLCRHLEAPQGRGKTRIYDVVQELAQPEDWILDRFGIDVLDIGRSFNTEEAD
jgi:hypothetical protein